MTRTLSFDLSSARVTQLLPASNVAPACRICYRRGTRETTRRSNRNGNAGRPYWKCHPCDEFLCFIDERGNDSSNPPCHCDTPSKRQVAGLHKKVSRGLHFVCRIGKCGFYEPCRDVYGRHLAVASDDLLDLFIGLRII